MNTDRPTFYVDIETTGTESNRVLDHIISSIKPRANLTDPAKIEADVAAKRDNAWTETALRGDRGRLACIGWAFNDSEPEVIADDNEETLLNQFFRVVKTLLEDSNKRFPRFVGYNVGFDLRFLWQRALVNSVNPSVMCRAERAKLWNNDNVLDLRYVLSCGDTYAKGTLIDWCIALNVDVPDDDELDGADVPKAWTVDALRPQVMEHCRRDVLRCQLIHERLREIGYE